jgi:Pectinacetylesterase
MNSLRSWAWVLCAGALAACGGESGGSTADDGRATEPLPKGEPIEAEADTWTWVDFPKTRCMDDSATGLGVILHPESDKVLIYIQGGGACFNATTCAATANVDGFGETKLANEVGKGVLSEDDENNPFRDWNKVFIPYCSGDIFSGSATKKSGFGGRTQQGYVNMREYLTRLVPTFQSSSHVVLGGYSAGGFAATVNWVQAIEGFGEGVRVDVLNDSGPPLGEKYLSTCLQKRLAETWKWAPSIPKACTDCDVATGHVTEPVMKWAASITKDRRIALISSNEDTVIKLFYGYGLNDCANIDAPFAFYPQGLYPEGLEDLQTRMFADHPGFRSYVVESISHVWTLASPGEVTSQDVSLRDFLTEFIDPESDWQNVTPW